MAMFIALITVIIVLPISSSLDCKIPPVIRGLWYSYERGRDVETLIDEQSMTGKGFCLDVKQESIRNVNYTLLFKKDTENCYSCVKILVRTVNVVEKIESPCVTLPPDEEVSVQNVCKDNVLVNLHRTTLFEENYVPVNCRNSLEGVWQFSYQNRFLFTGGCNQSESIISACPTATGISHFLVANKKINITYRKCTGISGTFDDMVEYTCLGDWFVGRHHFFAVAKSKESRKNKKYRCFLKHVDNDSHLGATVTSECSTLNTVGSPEKMQLTPVNSELIVPNCTLPQNFSGEWIDTANLDADIFINTTHIVEISSPDEGRFQQIAYVCHQKQDTRYIMARHTFDGCQRSFICFEFVPREQNAIRYKRGIASITDDFDIVCSWEQHKNRNINKYDLYLAKKPVPVQCPFTGKFNFTQQGDVLFETQISVGITLLPRPKVYCRQTVSEFSVCERDHKKIMIYVSHCLSGDYFGRPLDFYSDPDYTLKCMGFWKENDKSYLLTHDTLGKYHCWIYQRVGLNRILMSQAIGPFCDLNQSITSSNYTEGAATALELEEYDTGLDDDQCPLVFHDGSNPWMNSVNITVSNITMSNFTISNIKMLNTTMSNITVSNITELNITSVV